MQIMGPYSWQEGRHPARANTQTIRRRPPASERLEGARGLHRQPRGWGPTCDKLNDWRLCLAQSRDQGGERRLLRMLRVVVRCVRDSLAQMR